MSLVKSLLVEPNLVTTIIPVFNRPEMIVDAVNSVLAQTHRPIEILIVNDGSTDNTPSVLRELSSLNSEVRVFTQSNGGPGVARERGRINARGEFIQYLDSDDLLLPNKFSEQIAALKKNSEADVCYGKTEVIKLGDQPLGVAGDLTGVAFKAMFPAILKSRWWFTSTPLYRRSVVEAVGPWLDTSNEEDWEYDCRVASYGGRLVYTNSFVSLHRRHGDHLSSDGATSPRKLKSRVISRTKMFLHAKKYMTLANRPTDIKAEDWRFFSDYAFLLARQCAAAGLTTEARAMLSVSVDALPKKTWQHKLFIKLVKVLGWKKAAGLVAKVRG